MIVRLTVLKRNILFSPLTIGQGYWEVASAHLSPIFVKLPVHVGKEFKLRMPLKGFSPQNKLPRKIYPQDQHTKANATVVQECSLHLELAAGLDSVIHM